MILYTESIYTKCFSDSTMKDAYLKACKWLSTNIISKNEFASAMSYKFEKKNAGSIKNPPTIELIIFVEIPEEEAVENHCKVCREVNSSFFMKDSTDCNNCKLKAFDRRLQSSMQTKKNYLKEQLMKSIERNENK